MFICFYRINIQGISFSQINLYAEQPLNTLMMNASVMGKYIVAEVLLAEIHGVRFTDFLFLFNLVCLFYFCAEATQICLSWVPNTALFLTYKVWLDLCVLKGGRNKGSQKVQDLLPVSLISWQNLLWPSSMTNALRCIELTFSASCYHLTPTVCQQSANMIQVLGHVASQGCTEHSHQQCLCL